MNNTHDKQQEVGAQDEPWEGLRLNLPVRQSPRHWVHATGSSASLHAMAVFYLKQYDYESARLWDRKLVFTLAKVVCNLRRYYLQDREATIRLIREFFNPRFGYRWTAEGIGLTWELVAPYAPSLGIKDDTAVNRERADDLYDRVVDLVLELEPRGRVLFTDLYAHFLALNPDLDPVPTDVAFGIAVGDVTGKKSTPSKGKRYYSGFRIPKAGALPLAA